MPHLSSTGSSPVPLGGVPRRGISLRTLWLGIPLVMLCCVWPTGDMVGLLAGWDHAWVKQGMSIEDAIAAASNATRWKGSTTVPGVQFEVEAPPEGSRPRRILLRHSPSGLNADYDIESRRFATLSALLAAIEANPATYGHIDELEFRYNGVFVAFTWFTASLDEQGRIDEVSGISRFAG